MVYPVKQRLKNHTTPIDFLELIDSTLLKAARQIYRTYCEVHPHMAKRPTGVAINRLTYRGKLLFSSKPLLLPEECFVPLSQIEEASS